MAKSVFLIASLVLTTLTTLASAGGPFAFSYNTQGDGGPSNSFREERRDADGTVVGSYGWVDPNGHQRVVNYRALGPDNFQATGDVGPDLEAVRYAQANAAEHDQAKALFMRDWLKAAQRQPVTALWNTQTPSWNDQRPPRIQARPRNAPVVPARVTSSSWAAPAAPAPGWNANSRAGNKRVAPATAARVKTSWDDAQGGRAQTWSSGAAYNSFNAGNTGNTGNAGYSRRVGAAPVTTAQPAFDWPALPTGDQALASSGGQKYGYDFAITHDSGPGQSGASRSYASIH